MPRYCETVMVSGRPVRIQFPHKPTPEQLQSAAEQMGLIVDAVDRLPDPTPEQTERQQAALERIRERNARIRGQQ